jgi:hypothetical protein
VLLRGSMFSSHSRTAKGFAADETAQKDKAAA